MADEPQDEKLLEMLRQPPGWQTDGFGIRGPQPGPMVSSQGRSPDVDELRRSDQPVGSVNRPFEPDDAETVNDPIEQTTTTAQEPNDYGFKLTAVLNADSGGFAVDVTVGYGEILYTPPDMMVAGTPFVLSNINVEGTEIWAQIIYDTSSLAITGRTIQYGTTIPDSTYGTLIVPIGFVDWTTGTGGKIAVISPHNRHCGDINQGFIFGNLNDAAGLFTFQQLSDPVAT